MKLKNERAKTVYLSNLGCSKNQVDSEKILGEFNLAGVDQVDDPEAADILLVNTCGFIEAAKEESVNEILELAHTKNKNQRLLVAGCLSERYLHDLKKELPEVDGFFGVYKEGEIVSKELNWDPAQCASAKPRTFLLPEQKHHAYLKIAEGCNRICGFCAIPHMRGKQVSRTVEDVVREAQELQRRGVLEISLVAQDLTFYGRELKSPTNLYTLLKQLLSETDIPWFRLMYAYPAYIDDSFIELMATEKRICKYLDIPIQHSHPEILQNMRRGYSEKQLRDIFTNMRKAMPNLALRTTVLVGYPGEQDSHFEHLLNFMEEVQFDRLGGFAYSDEEGTFAFDQLKQPKIDTEVVQERLDTLMALQQQISYDLNQKKVGQVLTTLVDNTAAEGENFEYIGRSEYDAYEVDQNVLITGQTSPGCFEQVRITKAHEFDLEGVVVS